MSNGTGTVNVWEPIDLSLFVPAGGYFDISLYWNTDFGNILFDGDRGTGIFIIYLNEQQVPNIIANKGALVSSDEIGGVKINPDDGTMSVSGEVGVSGINLYSLNRPDLWPDRTEIDFGSGLFGKRFSGRFTGTTVTSIGMGIAGTTPATFKVVNMGGWAVLNSETNGGFAFGHGEIYVVGDNTYQQVLRIDSTNTRTDAPYDVWVTYRK
jgi:hypothetical protein